MKYRNILILIVLTAIVSIVTLIHYGVLTTHDSASYVEAFDNIYLGAPDRFRTPIYPLVVGGFCQLFGVTAGCLATIIFQHLVFLISVPFFYKATQRIFKSDLWAFAVAAIYILSAEHFNWNNYIMTESLSTSGMAFLLFFTTSDVEKPSVKNATWLFLTGALLLMLRPAHIYIIPVFLVVFGIAWFFKRHRKAANAGLLATIGIGLIVVGYMCTFKAAYGTFAISNVSTFNKYYSLRQNGLFEPSKIDNPEIASLIDGFYAKNGRTTDDIISTYAEIETLDTQFPMSEFENTVNNTVAQNRSEWYKIILSRPYMSLSDYGKEEISVTSLLKNKMFYIYLLMIVATIVIIIAIVKRRIDIYSGIIYLLGAGHLAVAIIGAQGDWPRLIDPAISVYVVMAALVVASIFCRRKKV